MPMEPRRLSCQDVVALLGDYLESALGDDVLAALERHLRDCPPCVAYLNTYQTTRTLVGEGGRVDMPEEMRRRLREVLLEELTRDAS